MPDNHPLSAAERRRRIARTIQDRPGVSARELARAHGVTRRTICRDLDEMRAQGCALQARRGRRGGHRLRRHWAEGEIRFSQGEALGALLGATLAQRLALPFFSEHAATSVRKLIDLFPAVERRWLLEPLRDRMLITAAAPPSVAKEYRPPAPDLLRPLEFAFVERRTVLAQYGRDAALGRRRAIEPHALVASWPAWYLLVRDHYQGKPRLLRLDRFSSATDHVTPFLPQPFVLLSALRPAIKPFAVHPCLTAETLDS